LIFRSKINQMSIHSLFYFAAGGGEYLLKQARGDFQLRRAELRTPFTKQRLAKVICPFRIKAAPAQQIAGALRQPRLPREIAIARNF
jgi:hypothetical protein